MIIITTIHFLMEYPGNLLSGFNAEVLIKGGGLLLICLTVYAQTGLFFASLFRVVFLCLREVCL